MTIVVDTSVLIDHLRGDERAHRTLRAAADDGERLVASVVTKVEILAGMRADEEPTTRRLMQVLDWIPVDDVIAEQAGQLANRYLRSHPGVDPVDYIIAATTRTLDAALWTRNVKHFPMIVGLTPPY
jgi:predicted nucleic acid-binding protein